MIRPVLNIQNERLTITTALGFRLVFVGIALALGIGVLWFSHWRVVGGTYVPLFVVLGLCLFAALFLERWTFDRSLNSIERNFGLVFLYFRTTIPLDSLRAVKLRGLRSSFPLGRFSPSMPMQQTVALAVEDNAGRTYVLDVARGHSGARVSDTAWRLSEFCRIPLLHVQDDFTA